MGTMSLTAADIRNKKFHTVRLRPGYNEEDVDALLDQVEATLVALEGGSRSGPLLSADDVRDARFRTTRFGPGYREDEVDDFLDVVAADLAGRGLGGPSGPPPLPSHPSPGAAHGRGGYPAAGPPARTYGRDAGRRPRLTAAAVREQQFATTRLTTGYNEQEVDDFLDRAEYTIDALHQGRPERATLTAAEVERVQFATTRARPGYDPAQVDRFLDVLAEELRRFEEADEDS
ncbi:cell division protein DivIVA [Nocardiopsis sp. CNR-923]|uniref:DivIVA domain-containing protein n=1 Tax=Nocardiopsis sp. CNR-923 TaxID=1904965 RepID=UPI00095B1C34|nr:DivIVA domain-containing protein [Nocardiopsis sp. CNR-923]OLT26498.1 cell division protein DivIVA [Nocardiopsis sp. CNR-923]